jgi:hypothetical protein
METPFFAPLIRSIANGVAGIWRTIKTECNMRIHVVAAFLAGAAGLFFSNQYHGVDSGCSLLRVCIRNRMHEYGSGAAG